jgi:uncharacterized protein with PIN domain
MKKDWRKYPSHQKEYKTTYMRNYRRSMNPEKKEIYLKKGRAMRNKHKVKYNISNKQRMANVYDKNLKLWSGFIPPEAICPICNKKLIFITKDKKTSMHFDHRNEGKEIIKISPKHWLRKTIRTPQTEKLWESCNFGILCEQCNVRLPTINRKEFLIKALEYTNL